MSVAYQIFNMAPQTLARSLELKPAWKIRFFLTGTSTSTPVYQTSALDPGSVHTQPVVADAAGVLPVIYLNPSIAYRVRVYDENDVEQDGAIDPVNDNLLSQSIVGELLFPRTKPEIDESITPTSYAYQPPNWQPVSRYGVVGDGVTDDTSAITVAIAAATASSSSLDFGSACCKISSALVFTCGVRFASPSYGDAAAGQVGLGYPGFYPTGSGYTAVTFQCGIAGVSTPIENVTVIGNLSSRPTINGILIDNGQRLHARNLLATGLSGFGVKVSMTWDSVFDNISVNKCGNASEYAVAVVDGDGSTNECVFNRIQSEQGQEKSVFVSANTYNCTFNVIHAEQALNNGSDYTHDIRGNYGCEFHSLRLTGQNAGHTAGPKVRFGGWGVTYGAVKVEDDSGSSAAVVDVLYGTADGTCEFGPMIVEGTVNRKTGSTVKLIFRGLLSGVVTVEDSTGAADTIFIGGSFPLALSGNGTKATAIGSTISAYTVSGNSQILKAQDCTFTLTALPAAATLEADGCHFNAALSFDSGGQTTLRARKCWFLDTPTVLGNGGLISVDDCYFLNGITLGSGTPSWQFGPTNKVSGGSVSAGFVAAPGGSTQFYRGEQSFNIQPSAGQPKSWVCTVSGTPGTWVSTGNL